MLSTILVEHPWMTTVALAALVGFGPLVGAWLVPRARITRALLIVSIGTVALLTLVPTRRDITVGCAIEWDWPTLGALELMANVILFAPVVLVAAILTRRPLVAILAASGASAFIEMVQAVAPALGRSCSTNDWFSNTLGASLGCVLAVAATHLAQLAEGRHQG